MRKILNRLRSKFATPDRDAVILMYHQVTNRKTDPWALAVSPERFDRQLEYVKKKYHVVPFQELAQNRNRKDYKKPLLAITFDDGFRDNFTTAYPILDYHKLPATFFI